MRVANALVICQQASKAWVHLGLLKREREARMRFSSRLESVVWYLPRCYDHWLYVNREILRFSYRNNRETCSLMLGVRAMCILRVEELSSCTYSFVTQFCRNWFIFTFILFKIAIKFIKAEERALYLRVYSSKLQLEQIAPNKSKEYGKYIKSFHRGT